MNTAHTVPSSIPVHSRWVDIQPGFAGYLALPPAGHGPGLLLWQEVFGVNQHIRAVAEQYALDGFVVLAPDVFWRQAPRVELGYEGADRDRAMALMKAHATPEALSDIGAALQALRAQPAVGGAPVGSIGYCMGGRLAFLTAASTDIQAAVAYYPGGVQHELGRVASVRAALQFHFAGRDDHILPGAVHSVRDALPQAAVHVYPQAQHGFNCWARSAYDAPSAALAHGRAMSFLAEQLHKAT